MEEFGKVESREIGRAVSRSSEPDPIEDLMEPSTSSKGLHDQMKIVHNGCVPDLDGLQKCQDAFLR